MTTFRDEELLADVIARLIGDVRHVAVGNASPIPATAALLARERGNGRPYVSLLQSRKHNFFTDGARELFDCAGQGRIDVFFLSGGQIDGARQCQSGVSIGDYEHPKVRFPGSFGSAYLYYVVPKVILFRAEHSRRTLVPKVDFISAPGASEQNVYRPGGPIALVTNRCLFSFADGRFTLASVHPGHTVEEVDREHRLRFRPAGYGAGNAGALARDAQAHARGGGAATGRGLSAIRARRFSAPAAHFGGLKTPFTSWFYVIFDPAAAPLGARRLGIVCPRGRPTAQNHNARRQGIRTVKTS